ncbi:MAG: hypothetical protein ACRYFS_06150 [Janthinobacterium lividum]
MSDSYIVRLRAIRLEFESARQAISYVQRNWQKYDIYAELSHLKPINFEQAGVRVEQAYFIRLYAEFEGILKDHFATNLPLSKVPDKPKIDWLISQIAKAEMFTIDPKLRVKMDEIRNYRNSIAHRTRAVVPAVTLTDALSRLNTFLAKLPEPLT